MCSADGPLNLGQLCDDQFCCSVLLVVKSREHVRTESAVSRFYFGVFLDKTCFNGLVLLRLLKLVQLAEAAGSGLPSPRSESIDVFFFFLLF